MLDNLTDPNDEKTTDPGLEGEDFLTLEDEVSEGEEVIEDTFGEDQLIDDDKATLTEEDEPKGEDDPEGEDPNGDPSEEESEDDESEGDEDEQAELEKLTYLQENTGFEITAEDIEAHDGDLKQIVEVKKQTYVNDALNAHLGNMGSAEAEAVRVLLQGGKLDELREEVDIPSYNYTEADLEESVDLQRKVVAADLESRGFNEDRIKRNLKALTEDELFEESKDSLVTLQKTVSEQKKKITASRNERIKAEEEQKAKLTQDIMKEADNFFTSKSDFFKAVKVRPEQRTAMKKDMFKTLSKVESDLPTYLPVITALDKLGVFEGDFSKLTRAGSSNLDKALVKKLKNKKRATGSSRSKQDDEATPGRPYISRKRK